jgi:hypothetical protein
LGVWGDSSRSVELKARRATFGQRSDFFLPPTSPSRQPHLSPSSPSRSRQTLRGPAHARLSRPTFASLHPGVLVAARGGLMARRRSPEAARAVFHLLQPSVLVPPTIARTAPSRESGLIGRKCTTEGWSGGGGPPPSRPFGRSNRRSLLAWIGHTFRCNFRVVRR